MTKLASILQQPEGRRLEFKAELLKYPAYQAKGVPDKVEEGKITREVS